jgi:hypothetical protein
VRNETINTIDAKGFMGPREIEERLRRLIFQEPTVPRPGSAEAHLTLASPPQWRPCWGAQGQTTGPLDCTAGFAETGLAVADPESWVWAKEAQFPPTPRLWPVTFLIPPSGK